MEHTYNLQTYREIMHNIDEIVLFVGKKDEICYWNVKAVEELSFEKEEFEAVTLTQILPKAGEESAYQWEGSVYRKNGTCFRAKIRRLLAKDEEVEQIFIIRSIEKETLQEEELKKLSLQLKEQAEIKQSIFANVTHELRTPINGMKGMALLLRESIESKEQQETIDVMFSCCANMEHIVNDILDYSKLAKGKVKLEKQTFSFRSFLQGVIALQEGVLRQKNLAFSYSIAPDVPDRLLGDSYHLGQVLGNLLSNAVKFTKEGKVSVEVFLKDRTEKEASIMFVVADTGIGISEEKQEELFESFVQVDPSITREYGGTGLGLAIAKELVSLMHGEIGVESKPGEGSRFYFTVVLEVEEEREKTGEQKEAISMTIQAENPSELLERLAICMEFASFEKAEQVVHQLKEQVKEANPSLSKQAFRLELALRKGDQEKIHKQYEKLLACST